MVKNHFHIEPKAINKSYIPALSLLKINEIVNSRGLWLPLF